MQIGFKCPGINEYHTFESGYCINECDHQCVPASVLVHIQSKQRIDKHTGEYISTTALLGCMRGLYLERTLDYHSEPPMNWFSLRGTLLHNILENPTFAAMVEDMQHYVHRLTNRGDLPKEEVLKLWHHAMEHLTKLAAMMPENHIPDWESEVEYVYPLGTFYGKEWFLHGTIDVLRRVKQEIDDYKTIGDKALPYIRRGAKEEHIMQFNIYKFLVEKGYPKGMNPADYTPVQIKRIRAFYMTMMQIVATGSTLADETIFRVSEPDKEDNEVTREIIAERDDLVLKKGKKKASAGPEDYENSHKTKYRITYEVPEVPLMPSEDIEAFIKGKAPELIEAFVNGKMPEMCSPEMRAWKCDKFCPQAVRQACDAHNEKMGVKRIVEVSNDIPVESL